jgi:hypothetical protein
VFPLPPPPLAPRANRGAPLSRGPLLTIPTKVAPRILKLTDAQEARTIIEQDIEQALAELSTLEALSVHGEELLDEASEQSDIEG